MIESTAALIVLSGAQGEGELSPVTILRAVLFVSLATLRYCARKKSSTSQ